MIAAQSRVCKGRLNAGAAWVRTGEAGQRRVRASLGLSEAFQAAEPLLGRRERLVAALGSTPKPRPIWAEGRARSSADPVVQDVAVGTSDCASVFQLVGAVGVAHVRASRILGLGSLVGPNEVVEAKGFEHLRQVRGEVVVGRFA